MAAENLGQEASIRSETIVARARLLSDQTRSTTLFRRFLQALLFFFLQYLFTISIYKRTVFSSTVIPWCASMECEEVVDLV